MTQKVPNEDIEAIVGRSREEFWHLGRAVSDEGVFYILHSEVCLAMTTDLRTCAYSLALDEGVDFEHEDEPLVLTINSDNRLVGTRIHIISGQDR